MNYYEIVTPNDMIGIPIYEIDSFLGLKCETKIIEVHFYRQLLLIFMIFLINLSDFMGETERDYLLDNFIRISNIFSFSKMFFSQPWIICGLLKIIFLPNLWRPKDFFSLKKNSRPPLRVRRF